MVNIRQFCDQLSKDLEMGDDPIREEAPGLYNLPTIEGLFIKIGALPEGFSLNSILCECPKENPEVFLTEVMNANLFGHITRNCVLGLNEEGTKLTLSHIIDYNIDYKGFKDFVEDFFNVALFWKEQAINNLKGVK